MGFLTESFEQHFGPDFTPISLSVNLGKLLGIELELHRDGMIFCLSVEAMPLHIDRVAEEDPNAELEATVLVLPSDEILPQDLEDIKNAPTEQLTPYLVAQETE